MKGIFQYVRYGVLAMAAAVCCTDAWAQVQTLPEVSVAGHIFRYYDVQRGDNLYTVAEKLGISIDKITENNPASADGLTPGMRLFFPSDLRSDVIPADIHNTAAYTQKPLTHLVEKGESIYGIANTYGIPVERLIELNPQAANGLSQRMILRLDDAPQVAQAPQPAPSSKPAPAPQSAPSPQPAPSPQATTPPAAEKTISLADLIAQMNADHDSDDAVIAEDSISIGNVTAVAPERGSEPMSVAVILPFMSHEKSPGRTALRSREFLRGMLLAAREQAQYPDNRIFIRAFDTFNNSDSLAALMEKPEVNGADIIILPDSEGQMAFIERTDSRSVLLNLFPVKDTSYIDHSNVVQANIPHGPMYEQAIKGFIDKYINGTTKYLPVFLSRTDGDTDKKEFTDELRRRLYNDTIDYTEIEYSGKLGEDDLKGLDLTSQPVVYIPLSSSRAEFAKYAPALIEQGIAADNRNAVALFGYPEWVTFKGDNLTNLGKLNATIYSRFYTNDNDVLARDIRERYKATFGIPMAEAYPTQGLLGYDTGKYIFGSLRRMAAGESIDTDFEGVQNSLRLERASEEPEAGWVNNSLYLIEYYPAGIINKIRL